MGLPDDDDDDEDHNGWDDDDVWNWQTGSCVYGGTSVGAAGRREVAGHPGRQDEAYERERDISGGLACERGQAVGGDGGGV